GRPEKNSVRVHGNQPGVFSPEGAASAGSLAGVEEASAAGVSAADSAVLASGAAGAGVSDPASGAGATCGTDGSAVVFGTDEAEGALGTEGTLPAGPEGTEPGTCGTSKPCITPASAALRWGV